MGQTAVAEPELFIQASRVDHERVALPLADGISIKERIVGIPTAGTLLFAPIGVDKVPVVITPAIHDEDALERFVFDELYAERHLKLTHGAGRIAVQKHRVVLQESPLSQHVKVARPGLEWRDLASVVDVL